MWFKSHFFAGSETAARYVFEDLITIETEVMDIKS